MAIPIDKGAILSSVVRLEIIPSFVFETDIMINVVIGVTIRPKPEPDKGKTCDNETGGC